jgi:hypothetical protein
MLGNVVHQVTAQGNKAYTQADPARKTADPVRKQGNKAQ